MTEDTTNDKCQLNQFNQLTLDNLINQFTKIYSSNNLLVLDPILSPFINYLTTFTKLKELGKFQNILWLNTELLSVSSSVLTKYASLIVVIPSDSIDDIKILHKLIHSSSDLSSLKLNVVVENLNKNFIFQINQLFNGILDFESILLPEKTIKPVNITSKIKLFNWKTYPIYSDGVLITEVNKLGGINDYFERPLKQVNQLTDSLIQLLFMGIKQEEHNHLFKIRNIYGKGSHSKLLIDQLQNAKIPEFLNENMTKLEIDFYLNILRSNTDLVVLERNLDFIPCIFNQLNYHGIIDDLFDMNFENIEHLASKEIAKNLSKDELYQQDLKHLNFSSIGLRLNKLAKYIQQEFKSTSVQNETAKDDSKISDIKQLVSNLGNLSSQQELVKKHTVIGEEVLEKINHEYESFLTFQNDVFEMDYKLHLSNLRFFLNSNYQPEFIWATILLIGVLNDGISSKDLEWISVELQDNYGIEAVFTLEKLIDLNMIRVIQESSSDFFSNLGLTGPKKKPVANSTTEEEEDKNFGISGGRDVFKSNYTLINKFWNLHPLEDDIEQQDLSTSATNDSTNLLDLYPNPSFALPGNTVPLLYRFVESLYFRDFLKYKPINNIKRRPNWDNLGLNTMFAGDTIDLNLDKVNDDKSEFLIIVVIGGITRSELTCFKYLQERFTKQGKSKKIIVLSNGIINNRKLWKFMSE
ncbi:VPS33 Vacuolar protein sorting-associated protein 33 [Candida maltosa Xu316]|uniref:Homotypic vacuole fusion and vacuole protein sorting (HOPS) complex subunit, putative n=1 Tax=Candida maltosa (strain Xu316) TaxID=1245528 RepID=M3K729_CANMX|nr:Homotypic vacuole fusion and vacuole protein sorting (HOPS) complex subunit, putative [Candida maltosa Xu316]